MATTDKTTLKNWFKNKLKPTQEQFWAWMDSFWHKDESIPTSKVENLNMILGSKATTNELADLSNQVTDQLDGMSQQIVLLADNVAGKVDIEEGKGLSTEDFTTEEKLKLEGLGTLIYKFPLSEPLTKGQVVQLMETGEIEGVGIKEIADNIPAGLEYVFNSAATEEISLSFDPNDANKFVIAYKDNSGYGTAIVGTVNGTEISFGNKFVFNAGYTTNTSVKFDPNTVNKFVVAYKDAGNSNYGTAVVGTVNGTEITFGSEFVFNAGSVDYISVSFDPNTVNRFIVAYQDAGNSNYGTAVVGTVNGTEITFGSEYIFNAYYTDFLSVAFDPNTEGRFVVAYRDAGNDSYGNAIIGAVNGTEITFGSKYVFNAGSTNYLSVAFDPNNANKIILTYSDIQNNNKGTAIVGTINGTEISFGSEFVFNASTVTYVSLSVDPNNANKFVVAYVDYGNSNYGTAVVGTVNGSEITFGNKFVFNAGSTNNISVAFDPNNTGRFIVLYRTLGSTFGRAVICMSGYTASNLDSSKIIGIIQENGTTGESKTVRVLGAIDDNQEGLTIGATYYVQADGSISTISDPPAVLFGKAISSTAILTRSNI